jgi:hypothetical protein
MENSKKKKKKGKKPRKCFRSGKLGTISAQVWEGDTKNEKAPLRRSTIKIEVNYVPGGKRMPLKTEPKYYWSLEESWEAFKCLAEAMKYAYELDKLHGIPIPRDFGLKKIDKAIQPLTSNKFKERSFPDVKGRFVKISD